MSNLSGHARITSKAIDLLAQRDGPLFQSLQAAGVPLNVVARDLVDVVILGHWADFGQCHHFMRRFDGQSERDAFDEAVHWIWTNALDAARQISRQLRRGAALTAGPKLAGRPGNGLSPLTSSQSLGNAVHALQDSFAWGHAEREEQRGRDPGAIKRIKRYAGKEKEGHAEADELWRGPAKGTFSPVGWLAVRATRDLLRVIVRSAQMAKGDAISLVGFDTFRSYWLVPSPQLSNERDRAFDLIDKRYVGIRIGASNLKTLSFDEEGLAKDLIAEGTNTKLVYEVFERLRIHYSSDSDDVAELYVNEVRRRKGAIEDALKKSPELVAVLIRVMDEGWTSSGEQACIDYLRGLK